MDVRAISSDIWFWRFSMRKRAALVSSICSSTSFLYSSQPLPAIAAPEVVIDFHSVSATIPEMHTIPSYHAVAFRVRETARRKLRELFLTWICATVLLFFIFNSIAYDWANIIAAALVATIAFGPIWIGYKLIRFMVGR